MSRSRALREVALTFTSTSPADGSGTGQSVVSARPPPARTLNARIRSLSFVNYRHGRLTVLDDSHLYVRCLVQRVQEGKWIRSTTSSPR